MSRQRFIWPSIWTSENFLELTFRQRLLFIGMFSLADDEGRIKASSKTLKASIFPVDDITTKDIEEDLIALHNTGSVLLYTLENERFAYFPKWGDFQHPRYAQPSKIPSPPPVSNTKESLTQSFNSTDATLTQDFRMGRDGVGRVGMDRVGMDREIIHGRNSISPETDQDLPFSDLEKQEEVKEEIPPVKPGNGKSKSIWPGKQKAIDLNREFEELWQKYPKKEGKIEACKFYVKWRKDYEFDNFEMAILNYRKKIEKERTEEKFIQKGSTFFNGRFVDYIEGVPSSDIAGNGKKKRDFSGLDPDKIMDDYFSSGGSGPETTEVNNYRVEEMQ